MTGKEIRKRRVLIVSLPGMMQNLLKDIFRHRADVEVVGIASGGLSAVDLIKRRRPELVVIDSNLPGAEASQLIRWLKNECQDICSLLLVETTHQLNGAFSSGADFTERSYSLPDKLDIVLGNLNANLTLGNE